MEQNTRVFCLTISSFGHGIFLSQRSGWPKSTLSFLCPFLLSILTMYLKFSIHWHDERWMKEKGWEKEIDFSSGKQNQSAQMTHVGIWLHCAGQKKNVGLNPTQNPKIKEMLPFFSPFPLVPGLIETMPPLETLTECELSSGRDSLIG